MKKPLLARLPLTLIGLLMALVGVANAQATWPVQTLIPEVLAIRTPSTNIAFDLSEANYPPDSFPATYEATAPEGGVMPVQIFSNAEGFWSIELQISDVVDESGVLLIPAGQILYRVNGGVWLRADGTPQTIHTGSGETNGWQEITLEFKLELTGAERAGDYSISAVISGQRQTF